jgi:hypothetical protein
MESIDGRFARHVAPAFWLQAIAVLLLGDLIGYWMHRGLRGARLWSFMRCITPRSTSTDCRPCDCIQ